MQGYPKYCLWYLETETNLYMSSIHRNVNLINIPSLVTVVYYKHRRNFLFIMDTNQIPRELNNFCSTIVLLSLPIIPIISNSHSWYSLNKLNCRETTFLGNFHVFSIILKIISLFWKRNPEPISRTRKEHTPGVQNDVKIEDGYQQTRGISSNARTSFHDRSTEP